MAVGRCITVVEDSRTLESGCNFNTGPDNRRIVRTDRGQSESLGAMLLVAIVVIAVAVVAGALFATSSPTEHPNARIVATASESANGSTLYVEHRAGEPIHENDFEIVLRTAGERVSGTSGEPMTNQSPADNDTVFEPSEVWAFEVDSTISSGESVVLVYVGEDRVLLDETTVGDMGAETDTGNNGGNGSAGNGSAGNGSAGNGSAGNGPGGNGSGGGSGWWPPWPPWSPFG